MHGSEAFSNHRLPAADRLAGPFVRCNRALQCCDPVPSLNRDRYET